MDSIPFPSRKRTKVDFMWGDIQRRSEFYSVPLPHVPASYPLREFDKGYSNWYCNGKKWEIFRILGRNISGLVS